MKLGERVKAMLQNWLNIVPAVGQSVVLQEKLPREIEVLRSQLWYRGDAAELRQFFHQIGDGSGGFWASVPGKSGIRKIHSGLPAIIADTLSTQIWMTSRWRAPQRQKRWRRSRSTWTLHSWLGLR